MSTSVCQVKGSDAAIIFAEETTFGVFQTNPALWKGLRTLPGESLAGQINKFESNELNPNRSVKAKVGGNIRAGGAVPFELAPEGFLTLFKHLLGTNVSTVGSVGSYTHTLKGSQSLPVSLSFEKQFNDAAIFFRYFGMRVNSASFTFPQEGFVTGSFDMIGSGELTDTSDPTIFGKPAAFIGGVGAQGASIAPAAAFAVGDPFITYNAAIKEGNPLADIVTVKSVSLNINNNIDQSGFVIGSRFRRCAEEGKRVITGSMQMMFTDVGIYNKFISETISALQIRLQSGIKYVDFLLPRITIEGESPKISSPGPIDITIPFQALYDPNTYLTDIVVTVKSTESTP